MWHLCYSGLMILAGLRELRQQASELVRRAQAGEEVTITVAGRPSARLVAVAPRTWRSYADVAELFSGRADPAWDDDRDLVDQALRDPWTAQ
jgi:prevent-host-death family protein